MEILHKLESLGIILSVQNGKLDISAPKGTLTESLIEEIKANKEDLIRMFSAFSHIPNAPEKDHYPMTASQYRLWILSQFEEGSLAYNMPLTVTFKGAVEVSKLEQSFQVLIARYEIIRTFFKANEEGQISQYVLPADAVDFKIEEKDFSRENDPEGSVFDYLQHKNSIPFLLEQAPLLRASLLRVAENNHVFSLSMHHIIGDGWSIQLLVSQLIQIYNSLVQGEEVQLPELKIQYKDYAVWLNGEMGKEKQMLSEKYWLDQFSGELPVLDLPSLKARPSVKTYNGNHCSHVFSKVFSEQLQQFSKAQDATLFMVLMAGIKTVLYKYSNQADIIIGTPIAGREHPDLELQIGLFLNTLPIRTRIEEKDSFSDLVQKEKELLLKAYEHQTYPFDELVDKLNIAHDRSRSALFDVMIVLQNQGQLNNLNSQQSLQGLSVESYGGTTKTSKFDIEFTCTESQDGLTVNSIYNSDIYESSQMEAMLCHLENIFIKALENPDVLIQEIDYVSQEEKNHLLFDLNDTSVAYPEGKTILDLFEEQAQKTPHAIAIVFGNKKVTYKELDEQSNQLAHYLKDFYNIQPDDLVGIQLERSERMILSVFGILKSGGAYVPIDPAYPDDRVAYIIKDGNLKTCLDEKELAKFKGFQDNYSKESLPLTVKTDHLAYCIYTSGSTGKPKGVLNHHAGLYNRLVWMQLYLNAGSDAVFLQKTPYTFDVSVWELILPFLTGSTLVIAKPEGHKDPHYLQELIHKEKVTIVHFVPSMLGVFLLEASGEKGSSLAHIICSGEELPAVMAQDCKEKFPKARLHNLYGPTEAAIDVTAIDLSNTDVIKEGVSIGKPIANTKIYIVNEAFQLQPIGIPGELLISGIQVAKGYLNLPELTTDRFIPDPFRQGYQVYRTGDLAQWKPDGTIHYLGRMDNQVKIRGNRIELGEVEKVLMEYPGILKAVAVAKEVNNEKALVAYYLPEEETDKAEIRNYLQKKLPEYMVPSFYVALENLPMTASGKIDKKALPGVLGEDIIRKEYIAPRNENEQKTALIWQEVLGVEKVGITDNFFELGGDSIRAIRVLSKINKELGLNYKLADIYALLSISELLSVQSERMQSEISPFVKSKIEEDFQKLSQELQPEEQDIVSIFPMSDIELGMLYASSLNGKKGIYHDQFFFPVPTSDFNRDAFAKAADFLVQKHELLRTAYNLEDYSEPVHLVYDTIEVPLAYEDISGENQQAQQSQIEKFMLLERTENPFEIAKPGLWRMKVYKTGQKEWHLLFQFHHAILDGWSVASLMTELNNTYVSIVKDGNAVLKDTLSLTYKDYVFEQKCIKKSPSHNAYWTDTLEDYKRLDIFTDVAVSSNRDFVIEGTLYDSLQLFSKTSGISLKTASFAAYMHTLQMLTYDNDVLAGIVTSGRPLSEDGDKILGCFLNTIPFRVKETHGTVLEFTQEVNRLVNIQKQFEGISLFELHTRFSKNNRDENPFFDTMFNYVDFHIYNEMNVEESEKTEESKFTDISFEATNTFLDLFVRPVHNGIKVSWRQQRKLKEGLTIEKLHHYYTAFLDLLTKQPNVLLNKRLILSPEEEKELLVTFNDTELIHLEQDTIVSLFEKQVKKTPDHTAVVFGNTAITYRELNEKANQLGGYLREKFLIQPNHLIGVKLDRNEAMILAILGILKSGGAYVPIDTAYPQERIAYMEQDSNCKLVFDLEELQRFYNHSHQYSKEDIESISSPEDLAYVIYTSGTTGNPKGVMIEHRNAVELIKWSEDYYQAERFDIVFATTSYCFDLSVYEMFYPLSIGKKLRVLKNGLEIGDFINKDAKILINTVPSVVRELLEENVSWENVSVLNMAGEPISNDILQKLPLDTVEVYNLYGPTEDTTYSTYFRIQHKGYTSLPIGKPLSNTRAYILDTQLKLVPVGIPGKIYLSGAGLARGYLNKPELTAEKFIENPFLANTKMYDTGDLGAWLPDGNIEYLGRKDQQVKIRGFRIELGEIEARIVQYSESLKQVVVVAKEMKGEKVLVAYYVAASAIDKSDLRNYLSENLPDYMIPGFYVELVSMPLNSNGKIDRKELPGITGEDIIRKEYTAPRNETERKLALIWQEVLGMEKIGVFDNFYEIGGNSLKSIQVSAKLKKEGYELSVLTILKYPRISDLVPHLETIETVFEESYEPNIYQEPVPLSVNQKVYTNSTLYAHPIQYFTFELAPFNKEKFDQTISNVFECIPELRMKIYQDGEETYQQLVPFSAFTPHVVYSQMDLKESKNIQDYFIKAKNNPFDLEKGDMCHIDVCHDGTDAIVQITIHHIVTDFQSNNMLIDAINEMYNGHTNTIDLKTGGNGIFSKLQRKYLATTAFETTLRKRIDSLSATLGSNGHLSPFQRNKDKGAKRITVKIGEIELGEMQQFCRANGILLSNYILSYCLKNYIQTSPAFFIDITVNSRDTQLMGFDLENRIGQFTNTIPVEVVMENQGSIEAITATIQKSHLDAKESQQIPYTLLDNAFQAKNNFRLSEFTLGSFNNLDLSGNRNPDIHLDNNDVKILDLISKQHYPVEIKSSMYDNGLILEINAETDYVKVKQKQDNFFQQS
ncbi:non-ribosomal peptide synthetase [Flavobacterium humi]|uniref:Amino acid adenylation domain-containing protein n=1 Tax=Flavobacterium humi TaxID=2562683 RepID=A0A4Z0L8L2_9FLAO|nr:non-ribosomal peptide synthetase [Flavobacterium humi]TGD57484.1 amino acid adenylation domain-containing protein [Flavobacterium humi]